MTKFFRFMVLMLVAMLLAHPAFAQEATTTTKVVLPWGDFIASLLNGAQQILVLLMLAAVTAVVGIMPAWVQTILRPLVQTWQTNQLFEKLAATAVAGTKGVVAGKTVEIDIANDMIRNIVQMAITNGSPKLLEFIGSSAESLGEKALARLQALGVIPADYTLDHAVEAAQVAIDTSAKGA